MERHFLQYFKAEKSASIVFICFGSTALAFGLFAFFFLQTPFFKALSVPLVLIALLQLSVGITIFFSTEEQVSRLSSLLREDPLAFAEQELNRMEKINTNFKRFRNVELLLFILGLSFVLMGGLGQWGPISLGLGIGLSIQSAISLILDLFAEWRAEMYTHHLRKSSAL